MVIPVKSISELEEKSEVSASDKILILDSVSEEARLASKDELKGDPGTPGQDGEDGAAATITVGSTTTGTPGSSASVTNSGTSSAAVLDFTIPQGAKGEPGEDGDDGAAATITVGTTTTLPAGSSATVTNVGTSQDAILNFGIPKGDSGTGSGDVNGPASSTDGHLAVFDGATGKIIKDGGAVPTVPTKVSDLTNDSGYLTSSTGVTSVNGNHGAVTISEFSAANGGVKVFDIPSVSDDISGMLSRISSGGCCILKDVSDNYYTLQSWDGVTDLLFQCPDGSGPRIMYIEITYDGSNIVTLVDSDSVDIKEFKPGGTATTGYVVTKTASGYEWTAPSGGDVVVSTQTGNILQSGMKIWAGLESDYLNLGTYDSNCLYLVIE